jgi:uncharacterized protein (DUF2267 family)
MTDQELTAAVARQGGVSEDEARAGLSATLEAFGARLAGGSVDELAGALPPDAADAVRRGRTPAPEQGSLTDIAERVGSAVGGDATAGANLLQASMRAVADAVGDRDDVLDRIRAQLPSDLQRLLLPADEGDTSALQTGA